MNIIYTLNLHCSCLSSKFKKEEKEEEEEEEALTSSVEEHCVIWEQLVTSSTSWQL